MTKIETVDSMGRVAVVGSANMDLVFRTDRLPLPGETVLGGRFDTSPGGKGANQAAAIGRLGGSVDFIGKVGSDAMGADLLASLTSLGVRTEHALRTDAASSGVAAVLVQADGENCIVVSSGANELLTQAEVAEGLATCMPAVTLAQLEIPIGAVSACIGSKLFVLNPAPWTVAAESILPDVDVLTPNESETRALTGIEPADEPSCRAAAAALHERGVRWVVLTLGARGCYVSDRRTTTQWDPPSVRAFDTTGAGDAFSGALAHFLALGRDLSNAARLANCVAALCTTVKGAQAAMPTLEDVRAIAPTLV